MHRSLLITTAGLGLIACLLASMCLSVALSSSSFAAQPRTYQATVIAVLHGYAVPYRDVQVQDECQPNPSDCFALSVIVITKAHPIIGQIEYRLYHQDCTLSLPKLRLHRVPLPPLREDPRWVHELRYWTRHAWRTLRTVR